MSIVDTHCHTALSWFEPVETLVYQMDTHGVDKAVLVQHRGEFDNSYLLDCARRYPGRFAVMGLVDTSLPDAPDTLAAWHAKGMNAVRLFTPNHEQEADPVSMWRKAAELGMPVSTPSHALDLTAPAFISTIEELSALPIIVEHYGFLRLPHDQWDESYQALLGLARFPNVHFKVHGFGELMPRPFPARNPPFDLAQVPDYLDRAIDAFGADRLMLATDWPPSAAREGYPNVLRLIKEYLGKYSDAQQAAILGDTAERVFTFA